MDTGFHATKVETYAIANHIRCLFFWAQDHLTSQHSPSFFRGRTHEHFKRSLPLRDNCGATRHRQPPRLFPACCAPQVARASRRRRVHERGRSERRTHSLARRLMRCFPKLHFKLSFSRDGPSGNWLPPAWMARRRRRRWHWPSAQPAGGVTDEQTEGGREGHC